LVAKYDVILSFIFVKKWLVNIKDNASISSINIENISQISQRFSYKRSNSVSKNILKNLFNENLILFFGDKGNYFFFKTEEKKYNEFQETANKNI